MQRDNNIYNVDFNRHTQNDKAVFCLRKAQHLQSHIVTKPVLLHTGVLYARNKGTDQSANFYSLVSTNNIGCFDTCSILHPNFPESGYSIDLAILSTVGLRVQKG